MTFCVRSHTPLWVPDKYIKYCFLGKQFIWQYDTFILPCSYWMLEFVAGDFQVFSCWNGVLGFHQGPRNTWGEGITVLERESVILENLPGCSKLPR